MAKLVYLILLLLFLLLPVFGSSFYVAFDVMSLDSFIADGNRVSFDFSYRYGDFRISLPVSYSFCLDDDISALDVALRVDAYPFRDIELFFGVDVLRYLRFFGLSSPQERNVLLSSISIGYTFFSSNQESSHRIRHESQRTRPLFWMTTFHSISITTRNFLSECVFRRKV